MRLEGARRSSDSIYLAWKGLEQQILFTVWLKKHSSFSVWVKIEIIPKYQRIFEVKVFICPLMLCKIL